MMGHEMPDAGPNYRFADFVLDVAEHRLTGSCHDTYLPPKTFETLLHLVRRSGHLVTKKELLDVVWGDVAVTENALARCIKEVREALDDDVHQPRFIETVPRLGYRFIAEVESVAFPSGDEPRGDRPIATTTAAIAGSPDRANGSTAVEDGGAPIANGDSRAALESLPRLERSNRTRPAIAGVLVLVAALTVGSLAYLYVHSRRTVSFGPRDSILITDFDNQTGEPLFDRTLPTALAAIMEQSPYARVFPRTLACDTLRRMGRPSDQKIDKELGREICLRENIRGLLVLSVARLGRQYALSEELTDPRDGTTVRSVVEYAVDQDHVLPALRSLAARVRRDLGESLSSIEANNLELLKVTTPSLKALKFYTDGVALWEKGQYGEAMKLYLAAVKEDPDFAKAHDALGAAYYSHIYSNPAKGKEHFDKALQLSSRTTDRERQTIEIRREHTLRHYANARDLYRIYLQAYPDDYRIRYNFGILLRDDHHPEEAALQFEQVLRLCPSYAGALINMATCHSAMGKPAEALEWYAKAFTLEPTWLTIPNLNHEYGFALAKSGDVARARAVFTKALSTDIKPQALRSIALLDMLEGRYRQARARLEEAVRLCVPLKNTLSESRNHLFLAILFEGLGDREGTLRELGKAVKLVKTFSAPSWMWIRIGVGYARAGDIPRAAQALEFARKQADLESLEEASEVHRLEGELELARGDHRTSMNLLVLADDSFRTPFTVESLARAYRVIGEKGKAATAYEVLLGMKCRSLGFEPQQGWVTAHYWLAEIYMSDGNRARAKELIDGFREIWKQADSDLLLLRKAHRLAAEVDRAVSSSERGRLQPHLTATAQFGKDGNQVSPGRRSGVP